MTNADLKTFEQLQVDYDRPFDPALVVTADYTNWKGIRRERKLFPFDIIFTQTPFHPRDQWLLLAVDMEDNQPKHWALEGFHSWKTQ